MKRKTFVKVISVVASIALLIPLFSALLPDTGLFGVFADQPRDRSPIKALICQPGTDETELNFAWFDNTGEPGTVYIAERTDDPDLLDNDGFPKEVQFTAESEKTDLLYTSGPSNNYRNYKTNRATVSGLERGVDYVYRVGNGDEYSDIYDYSIKGKKDDWSFYFSGDPQLNNDDGSVNYSVTQWISTIDKIRDVDPDVSLFVLGGDLADAGGGNESQLIEGLLGPETIKEYAVATSVGNHDQFTTGKTYRQHFNQPNQTEIGAYNDTTGDYWYRYHNAIFIHITTSNFNDVNTSLRYVDQHKEFIKDVLDQNSDCDWHILVFHEPIYSSGWHTVEDATMRFRPVFAPVLKEIDEEYDIDVILNAHEHIYSRSYWMDGLDAIDDTDTSTEWTDPEGILHVTANTGSGIKFYNIEQPAYNYIAFVNQERTPNISDIEIETDPYNTSFHMTTYRTAEGSEYTGSRDASMTVVDEFTIHKTAKNKITGDGKEIRNDQYGASIGIPNIFSQDDAKLDITELTTGEKYNTLKSALANDSTFAGAGINSEIIDVKTDWLGHNMEFEEETDLFLKFPEKFATVDNLPAYKVYALDESGKAFAPETRLVLKGGQLGVMIKTKQTGAYALGFAGAPGSDNGGNNGDNPSNNGNGGNNVAPGNNNGANGGNGSQADKTVKVTKLKANKKSVKLKVKKSFKLKIKVSPANATNKKLTYTSSNKKVAKVSKSGKIKALKKGKATITVKATDGSGKSIKIKVKVK